MLANTLFYAYNGSVFHWFETTKHYIPVKELIWSDSGLDLSNKQPQELDC